MSDVMSTETSPLADKHHHSKLENSGSSSPNTQMSTSLSNAGAGAVNVNQVIQTQAYTAMAQAAAHQAVVSQAYSAPQPQVGGMLHRPNTLSMQQHQIPIPAHQDAAQLAQLQAAQLQDEL